MTCKAQAENCPKCGTSYHKLQLCKLCGTPRPPCPYEGDPYCHKHGKPKDSKHLYSYAVSKLADLDLEEYMGMIDLKSLEEEVAVGKILTSKILEDDELSLRSKMEALNTQAELQLKRKKIEEGSEIRFDVDELVFQALKTRLALLRTAFQRALDEHVTDQELKHKILKAVQEKLRKEMRTDYKVQEHEVKRLK